MYSNLFFQRVVLVDEFIGSEHERRESERYPRVSTCAKVLASDVQYLLEEIGECCEYVPHSQYEQCVTVQKTV